MLGILGLLAVLALMFGLNWLFFGGGRRYLGMAVMLFGGLLMVITAFAAIIAATSSLGWATALLVPGTIVSVLVGWLGYQLPRWMPPEPSADPILAALAMPTPTVRTLVPEDVLGQWRFYVEVVGRTVMVDLQPDGRYRQVITDDSGTLFAAPGGEWSLDGPNLNLNAYYSVTRGETSGVHWFFGDCQGDLILFVKDNPQAGMMLAAIRGEKGDQVPSGRDVAASGAKKPTRKANSRGPSLFASDSRSGH